MRSRLTEVSSIHYGRSPSEVANTDGQFPIIGTGGEFGRASIPLFNAGVVVPRKGSLGNPQLALTPFWPTDTTFAVLPTENTDIRWLYYCLLSYDLSRLNEATGVPSISRDWLSKIEFPNPGYARQKRIARILQTIDQAIEKTEALMDKYQQIKAGLMHDLFTRGIGPNGRLRPPREQAPELYHATPIGWIPKEWDAVELGKVADLVVGYAFKSDWFQNEGTKLLRGENVGHGNADWSDTQCLSPTMAACYQEYLLNEHDVVIGMDRTFTKTGVKITVLGKSDCPSLLVQRVGKFVPIRLEQNYLRWLVVSPAYIRRLMNQQKGMDIPHLSKSEILAPVVPLASDREQMAISSLLDSMGSLIESERLTCEKLQSKKSGLMHDLLTGEVPVPLGPEDVPEAASA